MDQLPHSPILAPQYESQHSQPIVYISLPVLYHGVYCSIWSKKLILFRSEKWNQRQEKQTLTILGIIEDRRGNILSRYFERVGLVTFNILEIFSPVLYVLNQ
jgi:hypothetical protein